VKVTQEHVMDVCASDGRFIKLKMVHDSSHQSGFIEMRHHLIGPSGEFLITGNFTVKSYTDA